MLHFNPHGLSFRLEKDSSLSSSSHSNCKLVSGSSVALQATATPANCILDARDAKMDGPLEKKRDEMAEMDATIIFRVSSSWSNQTFAKDLCSLLDSEVRTLTIDVSADYSGHYWLLPECLAQNATNLLSLNASRVVLSSFSHLPQTLTALLLHESAFSPFLDSLHHGFDSDNNVIWDDVFSHLQKLSTLTLQGNLIGKLPIELPSTLLSFVVSNNRLFGDIPASIFNLIGAASNPIPSFTFAVNGNKISGKLPEDLLLPLRNRVNESSFYLDFGSNGLIAALPAGFFSPLAGSRLSVFSFNSSRNKLNGTLEASLFPLDMLSLTSATTFFFDISFNQFSGRFNAWFNSFPLLSSFVCNIANNQFSGPMSQTLLPGGLRTPVNTFIADLSNNEFDGTIGPSFFSGSLKQNTTFEHLSLSLDGNRFDGSLSIYLFYASSILKRDALGSRLEGESGDLLSHQKINSGTVESNVRRNEIVFYATITRYFSFNVAFNRITSFPPDLLVRLGMLPPATYFNVSSNRLIDTIPNEMLTRIEIPVGGHLHMDFGNNSYSGLIPTACPKTSYLHLYVNHNNLSGTIPSPWPECSIYLSLDVSSNPNIVGEIPATLLGSAFLKSLNASNTSVSGNLTANASLAIWALDLSHTNIRFCSATSNGSLAAISSGNCYLYATEACSCVSDYSNCRTDCALPPQNSLPSPTVPSSPASSTSCSNNTRPSIDFTCINGIWTAPNIVVPTITVPSGAGTIVIGNTSSTSIIFNGLGSTVTVEGCATNLTSIVVTLDKDDIEKLEKEGGGGGGKGGKSKPSFQRLLVLLGRSSSGGEVNCTNLSDIGVSTNMKSSSCKKVVVWKEERSVDGSRTLGAYFRVDSSGCNKWWIIVVSVVVAVVIVGLAIGIVSIVLWNKHLRKERSMMLGRTDTNGIKSHRE